MVPPLLLHILPVCIGQHVMITITRTVVTIFENENDCCTNSILEMLLHTDTCTVCSMHEIAQITLVHSLRNVQCIATSLMHTTCITYTNKSKKS